MTHITISEHSTTADGMRAILGIENMGEYPVVVTPPFSEVQEQLLEWYFERYLRFPFTDQIQAREAAASVTAYGEALFGQLFGDRQAYADYQAALHQGAGALAFEIAGSPEFHRLHWEALKDPALPRAFALEAPMVRRHPAPQPLQFTPRPSPTINLLILVARPSAPRDAGYRTISRALVESLRQAGVPVQAEILRPGTYQALVRHLEALRDTHGAGFYHVIHFDVHGAVMSYDQVQKELVASRYTYERYGRPDLGPYEGRKAFLFFEGEQDNQADVAEAGELADLLITHQVPIAILNACQSGKQIGASETSLGSRLMQAGVQLVLAMGYSITVSAAERLMGALYKQLFAGAALPAAIRRARLELYNHKQRRAYYDEMIELEDWLLPVVYQSQEHVPRLTTRPFTEAESRAYDERWAGGYQQPTPTYGFVGRDLDILQIEKQLLRGGPDGHHNILLVHGLGGAGKTTLLRHLGWWWQTTHLVEQVLYFGYDERAWTRGQIMDAVARQLLTPVEYVGSFQPLGPQAQQVMLASRLRATRHLLILDNLESITGAQLAIEHTLLAQEQRALRGFLAALAGGRTLVLLGSRGGEAWLAPGTFGDAVYELPGLDQEAASMLADRILERYGVTEYRADDDFQQILRLLSGYPLALEVALANLRHQTPAEVLAALRAGDVTLDQVATMQDKTRSIMRCIDYSHSNLSPEGHGLLTCLAPFTSVIYKNVLPLYTAQLLNQPALAELPFERWEEVLAETSNWGLTSLHPDASGFLQIQPVFPYFLRSRLHTEEQAEVRRAVETAFYAYYMLLGNGLHQLLTSKEAQKRKQGQLLTRLEYENLLTALNLAMKAQQPLGEIYLALDEYWDSTQDRTSGIAIGENIATQLETYPAELRQSQAGFDLMRVVQDLGRRQLALKQYTQAEQAYQRSLTITQGLTGFDQQQRALWSASSYHQLGYIAQEQRRWQQAHDYFQQALRIKIDCDDRYSQARTYHHLGMVAQAQRQWDQAHDYYQQALQIKIDYDDRYSQAGTYHHLGMVAQEQRQWDQAHDYYQQALQIYIDYDDRYSQAGTYHQLGLVAQRQRQWDQAHNYYQQALQIYIDYNDRYEQAGTYHNLGMVAKEQRQWQQARDYFLKDLAITAEFQDEHGLSITMRSLARLWHAGGDAGLPAAVAAVVGGTAEDVEERLRGLVGGEGGG